MSDQTQRDTLRAHARAIWQAAVDAARPDVAVRTTLNGPLRELLAAAPRILIGGAGKAGPAMSRAVEQTLGETMLAKIEGLVNVPDLVRPSPLQKIVLHGARPAGSNQPTARGVEGTERILRLFAGARPDDVSLCLLSGGGSALLPAPAEGITLEDKQAVTRLLHACGATINEMNAVRKHLSRIKGGQLARAFRGKALFSLVISDVIGDPLDVIASGPTAPDPSAFADCVAILDKFNLVEKVPPAVLHRLRRGSRGEIEETPKETPANVQHIILANNALSLAAATRTAEGLGYRVMNLGSFIEGETQPVAIALAGIARAVLHEHGPTPVCILSGGETTVTLPAEHGKGGRNQEFALAAGHYLATTEAGSRWLALSGGTDGEDGPTDAAGGLCDASTFQRAASAKLDARDYLRRHDAYTFLDTTGDLMRTGLTETNVMDVRLILVR